MPFISARILATLHSTSENYPFDIGFDRDKLRNAEDWTDEELLFIGLICQFNFTFLTGVQQTFKILKTAGFSSEELVNALFAKANKHNFIVEGKIRSGYENGPDAFDFERIKFTEIEDYDGNPQNAVQSVEFLGEITGIILTYQERYNFLSVEQEDDTSAKKHEVDIIIQHLIRTFNIIYNLRIAYHLIVYKKVEVTWKGEDEIKLGPDPLGLDIIATINEIRHANQFNEVFFPTYHVMKNHKITGKKIQKVNCKDGEIKVELLDGPADIGSLAKVITSSAVFFDYLAEYRFEALAGADLSELLTLLERLSELIDSQFVNKVTVDTPLDSIPFKIRLDNLEAYLSESSDVGLDVVKKFLALMFHPKGEPVDFFRYPLYKYNGYVYLLQSTLAAPLSSIFIEKWLTAGGLDLQQQSELFGAYVKEELISTSKKLPHGIKWSVMDTREDFFKNVVVVETKENLVVLSCQCLGFTGDTREETEALDMYHQVMETFLAQVDEFSAKLTNAKIILPVCLTANVHYSGFRINGIPVLDLLLFKNYFSVGRYAKVKLVNDKLAPVIKDLYEHQYYANQAEFETNLVAFLLQPYPLYVLLNKLEYKENPLLPPESEGSISYHIAEMISIETENDFDIDNLAHLLDTQFFINDRDRNADKAINVILTKIFTRIGDEIIKDLESIPKLISAITRSKRITSVHLVVFIRHFVQRLKHISKSTDIKFAYQTYGEEIIKIMSTCFDKLNGQHLRLSTFTLDFELNEIDRRKVLSFIIDSQGTIAHRTYSVDEHREVMTQIILFRALTINQSEVSTLFLMIGNFVENLNFNQQFQTARELAEEAWLLSMNLNSRIHGINILFKCYIKQKNFLNAGIYGGLLVSILDSTKIIEMGLFIDVLYNLFRYFREFGYDEFAKYIWKLATELKLRKYDEQKFTIAYFNMRLSNGLDKDFSLVGAVVKYLEKNVEMIIGFGHQGIAPWVALCMNLQKQIELRNLNGSDKLKALKKKLQDSIDQPDILETLELQLKGISDSPKEQFIESLLKLYSAPYFHDFKYDILTLKPFTDTMFLEGLKTMDVDLLLLTSLVYNDQQLKFQDIDTEEPIKEFGTQITRLDANILSRYSFFIIDKLKLSKGQVLLWLVELNAQVYLLRINQDKTVLFTLLPEWDIRKMNEWIGKSLPRFYFNNKKNHYYDLAEQEAASEKLLSILSCFDINIGNEFEEILILKSVDMAAYPDNLIINQGTLLAEKVPICNILNLEHYISNNEKLHIGLKINAWLPNDGLDGTISLGHDELLPLLRENNARIFETTILEGMPPGDFNVFMAHGNLGTDGFKSFQSDQEKVQFNSTVFGVGVVAILFICNSGSLKDDFQSQDTRSLAQDLIAQGYQAVIAPFWKYDVTMANLWLSEFFKVFGDGYSISQATHLSNRKIATYDEATARMFTDPGGWAAMHLYGNPNIYINVDSE